MAWLDAPATKAKRADGSARFYEGPPPADTERKRKHYQYFCSLVWAARLRHNALHVRRGYDLKEKVLRDIKSFVDDHLVPGAPQDVDVAGVAFTEMTSKTKLTEQEVNGEVRRWAKEWRRSQAQRLRGIRGHDRPGDVHEPRKRTNA